MKGLSVLCRVHQGSRGFMPHLLNVIILRLRQQGIDATLDSAEHQQPLLLIDAATYNHPILIFFLTLPTCNSTRRLLQCRRSAWPLCWPAPLFFIVAGLPAGVLLLFIIERRDIGSRLWNRKLQKSESSSARMASAVA
eukprot:scaffold68481_cov33-Tisochrysis_lutea.AAC.1